MEECEENKQQNEESSDSVKAVSAVPTKTWGFRRTTIARREFMEEIGNLNIKDITPRRQTRGRGRGQGRGQASQAPVTSPSDTRRLRGRRSARAHLEATTLSQTPPDEETTSETSLDRDIVDVKGTLEKMELTASPQQPVTEEAPKVSADAVGKDDVSDRAEDSDDLTLKEVIQKVKNRHKHEESRSQTSPELQLDPNLDEVSKDTQEVKENAGDSKGKETVCMDGFSETFEQQDENLSSQLTRVVNQGSASVKRAPKQAKCRKKSAQTKQNTEEDMKKCKVDEESLVTEGTSVDSSSEACDPNALYCICRQKHNKRFMICCDRCHEWFHGDCVGITEARGRLLEENGEDYICPKCSPSQSPVQDLIEPVLLKFALKPLSDRLASASSEEDKPCENQGIKGKIRKASGLGNKKKIKIFHSVKEEEDGSPLPLCIGLGCGKNALPDSVYCGHECILQHAAVAMQSLSEPKAKPDIQAKVTTNPAPQGWRKSLPGTLSQRKLTEPPIDKGEELEEDAVAEKQETDAAPVSSESEHKATAAPQMAAITSSVFYKSLAVKEREKVESSTDPNTLHSQCLPQSTTPSDGSTDDKIRPAPSVKKLISNPAAGRAKKTMPGSPRLSAARQQLMGSVQVSKSTKKDSPRSDAPAHLSHTISSSATEVRNLPVSPAPLPPTGSLETHPNIQIRQNIRRSLTEILLERVSDCENLEMPESEIGKLAQNIEKEIFNMYFTTDQKYKNKYRSLMFNLKDHKNKGLLSQVIKGEISPFKLSRLSQQELQSRELWDTSHSTEAPTSNSQPKPALREEHSQSVDTKESSLVSERELSKSDCPPRASDTSSTSEAKVPTNKAAQLKKSSSSVLDLLSSMLKDTTSEHRTHLFDLKCRICTGQISADEEPPPKKSKKAEQKESEEAATPQIVHTVEENPEPAPSESVSPLIIESPASPVAEHSSAEIASPEFAPVVIPGVSTMSVTGRDPRTMAYRPAPSSKVIPAASSTQTQMPPVKETISEAKPMQPLHPPLPPPPTIPKSILMKPSSSSVSRFTSSSGSSSRSLTSHVPADRETSQFLSKQDTVWKGFLNMQTVAKFVTKGYLISGSADYLKEDLPDTIHIGGRIMPQMVWDYVDRLKTSPTKELCMIRFHPATEEEEVAYVSLFSYFNSRRRFGVVSNICSHIKDLYLIPLSAKESIPSILLPFEGPGLEQNRPNLLIGLVICQKTKRPGALSQEVEEKRPKIEILQDPKIASLPTPPEVPKPDIRLYGSQSMELEIPSSTTPPGSPPHTGSPDSDNSLSSPSTLTGFMSVIKAPNSVRLDHGKISHPSSSSEAESPSTSTPLQTILTTLFGRKNQDPEATVNVSKPSSSTDSEPVASSTTHNDPIVQQYQHTLNEPMMETLELDYDRPYDPEEEYNPALRYGTLTPVRPPEDFEGKTLSAVEQIADSDDNRPYDPEEEYSSAGPAKASEINTAPLESAVNDDIAYDPEDESIFEEMKNNLAGNTKSSNSDYGISSTATLSEQQKMLEELNKQIEEQKRQLEQQEEALRLQKAAVGMSMAHFSVSDALMSPPRTPSLDNYQAFQFGREAEEKAIKTTDSSIIDQSRDPRQSRDAKKAILSISQNFVTESCEREKSDQTEKSSQSGSHNSSVQVAFQFESEIQSAKSKTIMDTKEVDHSVTSAEKKGDQMNVNNRDFTNKERTMSRNLEADRQLSQPEKPCDLKVTSHTQNPNSVMDSNDQNPNSHQPPEQDRKKTRRHNSLPDTQVSSSRSKRRLRHDRGSQRDDRSLQRSSQIRSRNSSKRDAEKYRHRSSPRCPSKHRGNFSPDEKCHSHRREKQSPKPHSVNKGRYRDQSSPSRDRRPRRSVHRANVSQNETEQFHREEQSLSRPPQKEGGDFSYSENDQFHNRDRRVYRPTSVQRDNASQGEPEQFHHRKQPPPGPPRIWRSDLSQGGDDKSECRYHPPHGSPQMQKGNFSSSRLDEFPNRNQLSSGGQPFMRRDNTTNEEGNLFQHREEPQLTPSQIQRKEFSHPKTSRFCYTDHHSSEPSPKQQDSFSHAEDQQFHYQDHPPLRPPQRGNFSNPVRKEFHSSDQSPAEPPFAHGKQSLQNPHKIPKHDVTHLEPEQFHSRDRSFSGPRSVQRGHFSHHLDDTFNHRDQLQLRPSQSQKVDLSHPEMDEFCDRDRSIPGQPVMERDHFSQEEENTRQHFHPFVEQFGLRDPQPACNSQWGGPEHSPRGCFRGPNPVPRGFNLGLRGPNPDLRGPNPGPRFPTPSLRGPDLNTSGPNRCPRGPNPVLRSSHALFQPRGQRPPHPEMSQDSGPSQNIGPRWPCPGQFEGHSYPPDNCFERQNDSPQLRYDGPPPRFNESGPRGPPHGRFENRFPSPPHFDGPRGFTSQQCKKPGSHPPKQRGANNHVFFDTDSCSSQEGEIRPLREPSPPHLLRQNQPCQQDSSEEHRHPVERDLQGPHQFEEYKGQNMQRGQRGPHFGKHDKFEHGRGFVRGGGRGAFGFRGQQAPSPHFHGQRMPSPQHRGSFEDQNNPHSSGFHNQLGPPQHNRPRGPSPGQFQNKRGQLRPSFDGPNIRPLRHSGPLLPTPTQGPIQMLSPLGQGLDAHQECSWPQEKLPSTRWGSDSRENLKALKSGERLKNAGSEDPSSPVQGR